MPHSLETFDDEGHPDWSPTLNIPVSSTPNRSPNVGQQNIKRYERLQQRRNAAPKV